MTRFRARVGRHVVLAALGGILAAGCATGGPPGPERTPLPEIPRVEGEPSLYVAYPDSLQRIAVSDTNFIFGTTGTGAAELTVNGRPVEVEPNGAFLAFLPVPPPSVGDTAVYRLVARAGGRVDTVEHRILLPGIEAPREGVWVDSSAANPAERWVRPDETVALEARAAPGLEAWVELSLPGARPEGDTAAAPDDTTEGPEPRDADGRPDSVPGRLALRETSPGRYRVEVGAGELTRRAQAGTSAAGAEATAEPSPERVGRDTAAAADLGVGEGDGEPSDDVAPDTLGLRFVVTDGRDTATASGRIPLLLLDPARPPLAVLSEAPNPVHGEAGTVVGRPSAYGSYAWRLPPGSSAPVDRRIGNRVRLRLGPDLHAWVTAEDVRIEGPLDLGPTESVPTAGVGSVEARRYSDRARLRIPVGRRLPAEVRAAGPRTLELTVHGGLGGTERMDYGPADELIRSLSWEQLPGARWRLRVRLSRRVWGWDLRWEDVGEPPAAPAAEGSYRPEPPDAPGTEAGPWPDGPEAAVEAAAATDDEADDETPATDLPDPASRGVLVLDVRRPPVPREDEPLRGLRVAVDPGHPPVGAEGPTGLEEAEANLAVARRLARQLREAGAEPVLVRSGVGAVGLYERRRRARAAAAHVLVSIHNNALPDGLRPHGREGTSTYYYHDHARALAAAIQRGMLATMGLRDLGLHWGNLALPRESWMPSVLTEGAFMMIPRHEAALRTEAFQAAYARGVVAGLRRYLREVAGEVKPGRM